MIGLAIVFLFLLAGIGSILSDISKALRLLVIIQSTNAPRDAKIEKLVDEMEEELYDN